MVYGPYKRTMATDCGIHSEAQNVPEKVIGDKAYAGNNYLLEDCERLTTGCDLLFFF